VRGRLILGGVTTGLAVFIAFLIGGAPGAEAQTMAFATLVFAKLVYAFAARGIGPFYRAGTNPYLLGAALLSAAVMVAILAVPPVADRFTVTSLSAAEFAAVGLLSLVPFASVEAFKVHLRRRLVAREPIAGLRPE
jgi:Ca2+-transporting ATPase